MAISRTNASQPVPAIQPQSNGTGPASSSGVGHQEVADTVGQFASGSNAREAASNGSPVFKLLPIGKDLATSGGFEEPFGGKPEKTEDELKEEADKGGPSLF